MTVSALTRQSLGTTETVHPRDREIPSALVTSERLLSLLQENFKLYWQAANLPSKYSCILCSHRCLPQVAANIPIKIETVI